MMFYAYTSREIIHARRSMQRDGRAWEHFYAQLVTMYRDSRYSSVYTNCQGRLTFHV